MGRDCMCFRNALKSHVFGADTRKLQNNLPFEWFVEATQKIVLFLNTCSSRKKEQRPRGGAVRRFRPDPSRAASVPLRPYEHAESVRSCV